MPTSNRRRWFHCLLGSLFVLAAAAVVTWVAWPRSDFPTLGKPIQSVDVRIDYGPVQMQIVDPTIIQAVVINPLSQSNPELLAAKYEAIGTIQINYTDGSDDTALLFLPWGHWKHKETYWTADLSLLKEECKSLLERSSDPEAKRLLDTEGLWVQAKR